MIRSKKGKGIPMKFCWTTITVKNMEASLKFYQDIVKLQIARRFASGPNSEIVFLGDGETQVELIDPGQGNPEPMSPSISLGFEVDSLDDMMNQVKQQGIPIHAGPIQPNPAIRFFYVLDPNGLRIQFVENIKV